MAKRNPMNERYQKSTSPAGKTRKSAAAAKPKRAKAGESPSKPTKQSARDQRREQYRKRAAAMHPPTPEYRKMRRIWWGFLGAAIVLSTMSWLLWRSDETRVYGNYVLFAAYASMGIAVFIDWTRLRIMRQEWAARGGQQAAEGKGKTGSSKAESDDDSNKS